MHGDLPLRDFPLECRTYLQILRAALSCWPEAAEQGAIESAPDRTDIDHQLRIVFPHEARPAVTRLLAADA